LLDVNEARRRLRALPARAIPATLSQLGVKYLFVGNFLYNSRVPRTPNMSNPAEAELMRQQKQFATEIQAMVARGGFSGNESVSRPDWAAFTETTLDEKNEEAKRAQLREELRKHLK
jgi:hypothetical protein